MTQDEPQLTLLIKAFDDFNKKKSKAKHFVAAGLTFAIEDVRMDADKSGLVGEFLVGEFMHAMLDAVEGSDAAHWRRLAEERQTRIDELVASIQLVKKNISVALVAAPEQRRRALTEALEELEDP